MRVSVACLVMLVGCVRTGCEAGFERGDDGNCYPVEGAATKTPNTGVSTNSTTADGDGDGVSDADEAALGLDPANPDTDADGLTDGDEIDVYGTDPLLADTDGDTYTDADELTEGHDPLDSDDRIYVGYWPYYADKDSLPQGSLDDTAQKGSPFARFAREDQFGDQVDLFDWYDPEIPVILDFSAEWCIPCGDLAEFMAGDSNNYPGGHDDCGDGLRDKIAAGELRWITVLGEDRDYNPPDGGPSGASGRWADAHSDDLTPVLADRPQTVGPYVELAFWPTTAYLDGTLTVQRLSSDTSWEPPLDAACDDFGIAY